MDLKEGVVYGTGTQIDLETGEVGHSRDADHRQGRRDRRRHVREGQAIPTHNNSKGVVRAFDVRTGKKLWQFNTIPRPGEFGNDTWLENSWAYNGNVGVWSQITVDEELGLVYLPVETPSSDLYGGHRPGNNLFAESIVCLDLKTGQRKWHFQIVHHPIWNMDMPAAPLLADLTVDGRPIKAVAVPTKQSMLFVFDRVTGQPVWPIEERPVPKGDVPGEWYSPTQPFPTKPPAYARNQVKVPDDLIDFTPELRAKALKMRRALQGGTALHAAEPRQRRWPARDAHDRHTWAVARTGRGRRFDPETNIFYSHVGNGRSTCSRSPPPRPGFSDIRYVSGVAGRQPRAAAGTRRREPGAGAAAGGRRHASASTSTDCRS